MPGPIRLERQTPAAGQAGGAIGIGLALLVIGVVIVIFGPDDEPGGENAWVVYAVGFGFTVVGLVVAVLGLKMLLMSRTPETVLEVDRMPVLVGESFQLTVRQPGPVRLQSLRVNLICEQTTIHSVAGGAKPQRDRRIVHQTNVLDVRDAAAGAGEHVIRHATVAIPATLPTTDRPGQIVWRLEVWGRVRGWVDFGHPFPIDVVTDEEDVDAAAAGATRREEFTPRP